MVMVGDYNNGDDYCDDDGDDNCDVNILFLQ